MGPRKYRFVVRVGDYLFLGSGEGFIAFSVEHSHVDTEYIYQGVGYVFSTSCLSASRPSHLLSHFGSLDGWGGMELIASDSSALLLLSMQMVSIHTWFKPWANACLQHPEILTSAFNFSKLPLVAPFLACLSVYSTGRTEGEELIDKGLHFNSVYQLTGSRNIMGTLQKVSDLYCSQVAKMTYI
jgi:hypothetical protein